MWSFPKGRDWILLPSLILHGCVFGMSVHCIRMTHTILCNCNAALVPRCRVVCEGTITVLRANDIYVPPLSDCEISCTVKLDVDVLVSLLPHLSSLQCTCIYLCGLTGVDAIIFQFL